MWLAAQDGNVATAMRELSGQERLAAFLKSLPESHFQEGSSLNASAINYSSLKAMEAMEAMKRLGALENLIKLLGN
jgi:hypothetical protein